MQTNDFFARLFFVRLKISVKRSIGFDYVHFYLKIKITRVLYMYVSVMIGNNAEA